jgi:hypothetical protein
MMSFDGFKKEIAAVIANSGLEAPVYSISEQFIFDQRGGRTYFRFILVGKPNKVIEHEVPEVIVHNVAKVLNVDLFTIRTSLN